MYLTDNLADVMERTKLLHPQAKFAASLALNAAVRAARDAMPGEVSSVFDRPTAFTQQGFFTTPSNKSSLVATVGVKDRQASYMQYQVEGGERKPTRKALRLPSAVQLNEFGNLPTGLIRQLVQRAKANKRATKGQAKRFGVSQGLDLFYGEPGDGRPAGIYKRVVLSKGRHQLIPLVVFPQRTARYERRFDFYGVAQREVRRAFTDALPRAWERAIKTAR
jgi:hypothetical protein